MDQNISTIKKRLLRYIIFITCAVPGLFILLFCFFNLWAAMDAAEIGHINSITAIVGVIVGLALMLVGVGKWRQWQYGLVFLSVPLSFIGYTYLDSKAKGGKLAPIIFTTAVALLVNYIVKISFPGRKSADSKEVAGEGSSPANKQ